MKILYGDSLDNSIDVTNICLQKLTTDCVIVIPSGDDNRSFYFTDPLYGIFKKIFVLNNDVATEYDAYTEVRISIQTTVAIIQTTTQLNIDEKLQDIQNKLNVEYGSLYDELPEQKMVIRYLTGNEKVLEIGGNIGRNSLVIASILQDDTNLVTLESDIDIALQLI